MAKLIPLEDYVLIEAIKDENTTASGIILPDSKEKPNKGKVVSVGPGKTLDNGSKSSIDVTVGDVVYFTQYAPDEIELDEAGEKVKYLVIKHSSLLAKEGK
ncbi:MAG: co-chaperone GroES [Candidatus Absconditabacteria bacterium]|nr:co-chaperone GroES [Candidatus Absconditabacteria bacterium]MDD3868166.1 co-chaperone GroES [Candidatus Absconditabacteria bacterium]MDD4714552.1 co-chaperone GroES [Candidatus Absconditabacteria bacterium]